MSNPQVTPSPARPGRAKYLAIGFGCTVILWAVAYVGMSPAIGLSTPILAILLAFILLGAGGAIGRFTGSAISSGVRMGLLIGLVNFIVASSFQDAETTGQAMISALAWVAASTAVAIVLCVLGALMGARVTQPGDVERDFTPVFAWVLALATLPLLVTGGIVTGLEAGLAVPDWLTSFDYPMVLYPMAKMQADPGVYAEHFHRLWGLLVGLIMIMMVIHVFRTDARGWMRRFAIVLLIAVIAQGVLGGLRVTERGIAWAVVHGVFGQLVFSGILLLTAFTSAHWLARTDVKPIDRKLAWMLPAFLLVQLILGALTRHLGNEYGVRAGGSMALMMTHATVAVIVAAKIIFTAGRVWGRYGKLPVFPKVALWLLGLLVLQLVLGIVAMAVVLASPEVDAQPSGFELTVTTVHQANGALMLGFSFLLAAWAKRFAGDEATA